MTTAQKALIKAATRFYRDFGLMEFYSYCVHFDRMGFMPFDSLFYAVLEG